MKTFTIEEYQQLYLNEDKLQKCYEDKWFKLFVPKAYNGLELSMENGCRQLLSIAEIQGGLGWTVNLGAGANWFSGRSEEHTSELQSRPHLVCRLLLEKKKLPMLSFIVSFMLILITSSFARTLPSLPHYCSG